MKKELEEREKAAERDSVNAEVPLSRLLSCFSRTRAL
jgi:hypothetical protein